MYKQGASMVRLIDQLLMGNNLQDLGLFTRLIYHYYWDHAASGQGSEWHGI